MSKTMKCQQSRREASEGFTSMCGIGRRVASLVSPAKTVMKSFTCEIDFSTLFMP